jgi:hypothetical protein
MKDNLEYYRYTDVIPTGKKTHARCHCWLGWQCEDHPDKQWEHDDCGAAGDRCDNLNCPYKEARMITERALSHRIKPSL